MYELVYSSRAMANFDTEDILEMLEKARVNNADAEISGLLLYDGSGFVQLLEGDQASVEDIYSRIEHDDRHQQVQVLWRGEVEGQRHFANWPMAYLDTRTEQWQKSEEVQRFEAEGLRALSHYAASDPSTGRRMLLSLREAL